MNQFSPLQMEAMVANLQSTKSSQIDADYEFVNVNTEETILVAPSQDEIITSPSTTLSWEETGNATHYQVEVSRFPGFNFLNVKVYTTDLSLLVSNLQPDKTYYWRVTPFGDSDFCTEKTEEKSFTTQFTPVSIDDFLSDNFEIHPNPSTDLLTIKWGGNAKFNINFMNIYGQIVSSKKQVENGTSILHDLSAGIYLIEVSNEDKRVTKRIIVQ